MFEIMNSFHYVLEKKLRVPNRNLLIEWLNKLFVIEYHLKVSYLFEKKKNLLSTCLDQLITNHSVPVADSPVRIEILNVRVTTFGDIWTRMV